MGRYALLKLLAAGGMAEIYLARHIGIEGFNKLVVIKRIHQHLTFEKRFVSMFFDEARIAARLNHPNVVQIFDLGRVDGCPFIAMEYVEGLSLREIQRQAYKKSSPMPWTLLSWLGARACEGLAHAHGLLDEKGEPAGLVHRDVSPQNLIASFDGSIKLLDFGIARASIRLEQTQSFSRKGKLRYMSPEQVLGLPLDHRSDLFSLGIILWELLSNRRLFDGEGELAVLKQITEDPIPRPLNVPDEVSAVLMKLLEREPEDRFESAADAGEALDRTWRMEEPQPSARRARDYIETLFPGAAAASVQETQRLLHVNVEEFLRGSGEQPASSESREYGGLDQEFTPTALVRRRRSSSGLIWVLGTALMVATGMLFSLLIRPTPESPVAAREIPDIPEAQATPAEKTLIAPVEASVAEPSRQEVVESPPRRRKVRTTPVRRKRSPVSLAPVHGFLTLDTRPMYSTVFLDKKRLGDTPIIRYKLPAGRHRLRLVKGGDGPSQDVVVEIKAGKLTMKKLTF